MKGKRFFLDLGQNATAIVVLQEEATLKEFVATIKDSGEWAFFGNTSFQTIHIKRVEILPD